jgi:hypothetical protein
MSWKFGRSRRMQPSAKGLRSFLDPAEKLAKYESATSSSLRRSCHGFQTRHRSLPAVCCSRSSRTGRWSAYPLGQQADFQLVDLKSSRKRRARSVERRGGRFRRASAEEWSEKNPAASAGRGDNRACRRGDLNRVVAGRDGLEKDSIRRERQRYRPPLGPVPLLEGDSPSDTRWRAGGPFLPGGGKTRGRDSAA